MTFDEVYQLAVSRKTEMPEGSGTAALFAAGAHGIGKKLVEEAAESWMAARYDMQNPSALKRLVAGGTQLRPFTNEVLEACLKATNELWAEISAKNADFKKTIDAMQAYRSDQYLWWQVAEYTFDSFMIRSRTRG